MFKKNLISGTLNHQLLIPTEQEFQQIVIAESILKKQQLPDYLDIARDYFVIGCSTSLRYSEIACLTPTNIKIVNGQECIVILLQMTQNSEFVIPLNSVSKFFIYKQFKSNKFRGIKYMSIYKINEQLHSLFELLGFNSLQIKHNWYGGKATSILTPKWQAMSMHASRQYFRNLWVNSNSGSLGCPIISSNKNTKVTQQHIHKVFQKMQQVFSKVQLPPTIASVRKAKIAQISKICESRNNI